MTKEETISQDFEAQIPAEENKINLWQKIKLRTKNISSRNKKIILISGGLLLLMTLMVIIILSSRHISQFEPPVFPSPSPSPYEEEIINPSAYATDSAILEIGEKLKGIEQNLDKTDLREASLNPPVLDLNVNFEE